MKTDQRLTRAFQALREWASEKNADLLKVVLVVRSKAKAFRFVGEKVSAGRMKLFTTLGQEAHKAGHALRSAWRLLTHYDEEAHKTHICYHCGGQFTGRPYTVLVRLRTSEQTVDTGSEPPEKLMEKPVCYWCAKKAGISTGPPPRLTSFHGPG